MADCLKQKVRCVIVRGDGRCYQATNDCNVEGLTVCPRVERGIPSGEGYELCGSQHAEARAAAQAMESRDLPGVALIYGHTWICRQCQEALLKANVRTFKLMEEPA